MWVKVLRLVLNTQQPIRRAFPKLSTGVYGDPFRRVDVSLPTLKAAASHSPCLTTSNEQVSLSQLPSFPPLNANYLV